MNKPLLSICIPTFNGAVRLPRLLKSVIEGCIGLEDLNQIEVVVSDNASDDNTANVIEDFLLKHSLRVQYFRNSQNIFEDNFRCALFRGRGTYRKLLGDTFYFKPGSVSFLLKLIDYTRHSTPNLFFSNGHIGLGAFLTCVSADDMLRQASFWTTWIGFLGIWDNQIDSLEYFTHYKGRRFPHTYALYKLSMRFGSVISDHQLMLEINRTGNQNRLDKDMFLTAFGGEYLGLLNSLAADGWVTSPTLASERILLLANYVLKKRYVTDDYRTDDFLRSLSTYWSHNELIQGFDMFVKRFLSPRS